MALPSVAPERRLLHRRAISIEGQARSDGLDIVDASAETRSMPYPGRCDDQGNAYRCLIGLDLLRGFRHEVKARFGGAVACTHLTELARNLPTVVVQEACCAGTVIDSRGEGEGAARPFQIDRCHALRADGPAVRLHHARWYRPAAGGGDAGASAMPSAPAQDTPPLPFPLCAKSPPP